MRNRRRTINGAALALGLVGAAAAGAGEIIADDHDNAPITVRSANDPNGLSAPELSVGDIVAVGVTNPDGTCSLPKDGFGVNGTGEGQVTVGLNNDCNVVIKAITPIDEVVPPSTVSGGRSITYGTP